MNSRLNLPLWASEKALWTSHHSVYKLILAVSKNSYVTVHKHLVFLIFTIFTYEN